MTIVVGIDGGGTKTRAAAYTSSGSFLNAPLAACETGPCNIAFMPLEDAVANVAAALIGLGIDLSAVKAACAAVAGYSFQSRRAAFTERLQSLLPNARITVAPDYAAALRGALPEGRGLLVVAGTGSVACASDGQGTMARAGGYGYLIDDAGSGYGVGRAAIAAVLHALDGTGEATSLTERVAAEIGGAGWDFLIESIYGGAVDRVRIASLAECVAQAAADDTDQIATRILMQAGGALARLAEAACRKVFGAEPSPLAIARAGSLWNAGPPLADTFARSCTRFAPRAEIISVANDPVYGAGLMAGDLL